MPVQIQPAANLLITNDVSTGLEHEQNTNSVSFQSQNVATHTPGPWTAKDTIVWAPPKALVDGGTFHQPIADCSITGTVFRHEGPANARLISAAPDMLADHQENARLLTLVLHDLVGRVEAGKLAAINQCLERSRKSIAKATGAA